MEQPFFSLLILLTREIKAFDETVSRINRSYSSQELFMRQILCFCFEQNNLFQGYIIQISIISEFICIINQN